MPDVIILKLPTSEVSDPNFKVPTNPLLSPDTKDNFIRQQPFYSPELNPKPPKITAAILLQSPRPYTATYIFQN